MWHVSANSICGEMHLSLPSLPIDLLRGEGRVVVLVDSAGAVVEYVTVVEDSQQVRAS